MSIPPADAGHGDPTAVPDQTLEIRVDNSGDGFVARIGGDTTVPGDRAQLKSALDAKRQMLAMIDATPDAVRVVLAPGRDVKYDDVILVYEGALRAGFRKVGFATSH